MNNKRNPRRKTKRGRSKRQDLVSLNRLSTRPDNNHVKMQRTAAFSIDLTQTSSSGSFGGTGLPDIEFAFSLSSTFQYSGGTLLTTISNPGYAEIANLFQEYRIDSIEIQMIWSNTNSQISNSACAPLFNIVTDYTGTSSITQSQILQYDNLKVVQFGDSHNNDRIVYRLRPVPSELVYNGVTSGYIIPTVAPFINTSYTAVPHYGLKIFYDQMTGASPSVSIGIMSFYIRYFITARKTN